MKKIHTKALILLAAATATSCDDKFEVVETGERIEDVVEITVHDVEVDWNWNKNSECVTVGTVIYNWRYSCYTECPDWLNVEWDLFSDKISVACTDEGYNSKEPREGVVTITVANGRPGVFIEVDGGGKVEMPYQEIKKSFTVPQAGRPTPER